MLSTTISRAVTGRIDKFVLYTMNRRVPDSFNHSYGDAPTLEDVLAETRIDRKKTAVCNLTAPGEHKIWLDTLDGSIQTHIRVRPAADPNAPLILYHHGFSELPYYSTWQRIFPKARPYPAHTVCVQAPFHNTLADPFAKGFASMRSLYQMFAGSMRVMELLQTEFETQGADFTMLSGVSWGGITSLLYEGLFQRTRAVAPLLSSPNFAQVLVDIADRFNRPLPISEAQIQELLDFTDIYQRIDSERVFPLLGENDQFFPIDRHAGIFKTQEVVTVPSSHISGMWRVEPMRQHIRRTLDWAVKNG